MVSVKANLPFASDKSPARCSQHRSGRACGTAEDSLTAAPFQSRVTVISVPRNGWGTGFFKHCALFEKRRLNRSDCADGTCLQAATWQSTASIDGDGFDLSERTVEAVSFPVVHNEKPFSGVTGRAGGWSVDSQAKFHGAAVWSCGSGCLPDLGIQGVWTRVLAAILFPIPATKRAVDAAGMAGNGP